MVINQRVGLAPWAIAAAGLGFLLAGFYLLVPEDRRGAVAWLDLGVCAVVFLVNFANLAFVRPRPQEFSQQIPKLGLLWTAHVSYTVFALGGIWRGWVFGSPFRFQVFYQAIVLFALIALVSVANRASEHVAGTTQREARLRSSLTTLKQAVGDCDSAFLRVGAAATREYTRFQAIKDDIRYLSPCTRPEAESLDGEIVVLLQELCSRISSAAANPAVYDGPAPDLREKLAQCEALVHMRKQIRQEYEHR